jgi:hypothetical protein
MFNRFKGGYFNNGIIGYNDVITKKVEFNNKFFSGNSFKPVKNN